MRAFNGFSYQYYLNGGTGGGGAGIIMRVSSSMQDEGIGVISDVTSYAFNDVTNDLFGVTSIAVADLAEDSGQLIDDAEVAAGFTWVRATLIVSSGNNNTADWTLRGKRWK